MKALSTALVTGGTGFLGTALVQHLVASGIRVSVLARPASVVPDGAHVIRVPGISRDDLSRALRDHRFEVVFHLAAYGVTPTDRDSEKAFATNIGGTDALIRVAADLGVPSFVYLGSCSEYAPASDRQPIPETAPLGANGIYGASKAAAGLWGEALASQLGIGFQWIRLFNVFGPGEAAYRLIPALIAGLKSDKRVSLSPGEQVRDFLYVDDAVRGLRLAGEAAMRGETGAFNLCSGHPVSVKEIALLVAAGMNKPADLLAFGALDYRPDETHWLVGRSDRFRNATGFAPALSMAGGIERMIAALGETERTIQ